LALSVAGIALGIALGYAVHLVNRAAVAEVAAAVRSVAGEADIEVRGGRSGFPESLYPSIAKLPGVSTVSPVLELDAGIAGTEATLHVIGLDILRAAILQPALASAATSALLAARTAPPCWQRSSACFRPAYTPRRWRRWSRRAHIRRAPTG